MDEEEADQTSYRPIAAMMINHFVDDQSAGYRAFRLGLLDDPANEAQQKRFMELQQLGHIESILQFYDQQLEGLRQQFPGLHLKLWQELSAVLQDIA